MLELPKHLSISFIMPGCSAVGCTNRTDRKKPGVSFHRFPKDTVLRAAWIVACRRKNWLPSPVSVLCSEHFSEDLIDRTSLAITRLRENAIPNIFTYSSEKSNCLKISEKHLSPKKHLTSTPLTVFINNGETQSCNESTSETAKECGKMETAVCLYSSENESSVEYVLPEPIPEKHKSPEKRSAFKAALTFVNEVMQSGDDSSSETPTKKDVVMKPTVCSNSRADESSVENRPPVQVPQICKSPKNPLPSTAFFINQVVRSSDESASKGPRKCYVIRPTACFSSPIDDSVIENRPPLQIPKKRKFPEKHLTSTDAAASSSNELIGSSDENISDDSSECNVMGRTVCTNSTINESDVKIPVQESDSEDYPLDDVEKKNLKRKLSEANDLIMHYRKKIKCLQQQNRRFKKQMEKAKRSIKILQETNKSVFQEI